MKNRIFASFVILLVGCQLFAQSPADSISIKPAPLGGHAYYQHGKRVPLSRLPDLMRSNKNAVQQIEAAQTNIIFASVLGGVGGALVGYNLAQTIVSQKPAMKWVGVGAAIVFVGFPIEKSGKRKAKAAIATFNSGLGAPSPKVGYRLGLGMQQNGLGLALRF